MNIEEIVKRFDTTYKRLSELVDTNRTKLLERRKKPFIFIDIEDPEQIRIMRLGILGAILKMEQNLKRKVELEHEKSNFKIPLNQWNEFLSADIDLKTFLNIDGNASQYEQLGITKWLQELLDQESYYKQLLRDCKGIKK